MCSGGDFSLGSPFHLQTQDCVCIIHALQGNLPPVHLVFVSAVRAAEEDLSGEPTFPFVSLTRYFFLQKGLFGVETRHCVHKLSSRSLGFWEEKKSSSFTFAKQMM